MTSIPEGQTSNPTLSHVRPLIPIVLIAFAMGLYLLLLWRVNATPSKPSPPTPTKCSHWIALRGTLQHSKVVCWRKSPHSRLATVHLRRWRSIVQQAKPTCILPSHLPIPHHAHQLILFPSSKDKNQCHYKIAMMRGKTRIALGIPLQLRREMAQDLAAIPGLSLRLAQRIIAYQKQHGPFRRLEDLAKVKGIGHKTIKKLKPYLTWKKKHTKP